MKKVQRLLSMTDGDERKHVLDYTHVDLHYVEDQRKNLLTKFNSLNQELSSCKSEFSDFKNTKALNCSLQYEISRLYQENESLKDEISDLKKVIEKWTSSKVMLDQLLTKQVPGNIVHALGGRGKRKDAVSLKEEPLPPLPMLSGAEHIGTLKDVITLTNLTQTSSVSKKTKKVPDKESSVKQLLLTLMEEVRGLKEQINPPSDNYATILQTRSSKSTKGKQNTWFGPWKHCGVRFSLSKDCYIKPKCSTCGSTDHLTKEHPEQTIVKKTMAKLKAQSSQGSSSRKALKIPKPFIPCKYYEFNNHHSNECEYYPRCDLCGSIAHETTDCVKNSSSNNRKPRIANHSCSIHMTGVKHYLHKYSKKSGPKAVFGDNSSGDTEGYGLVNCNGITFTKGIIFNQNNEVVLIAPRRRDVYVIDMSYYNEERQWQLSLHSIKTGEAVNTACYTQNRSIIVKSHGKTVYDVFKGRSIDISYFHMFGCPVHIHNHRDHLGKFDEKANGALFLSYSPVAKAFRVFNIRRQEMEETYHVIFSEDDEAITKSSTEGDEINFDENRSFHHDEFLIPYNNSEFSSTYFSMTTIASVTTRSRIKDSKYVSAHKCLYVNFLSKIKPNKLIEALEEEG
ncbi:retrovirus-related pol polyprotein from transposon TNT 1-94 [Tanacetum coccineum]